MKNIFGTDENIELSDKNGKVQYAFYKAPSGRSYEHTYDSNGEILTRKNSDGYSYEYTRDSYGNELTYKNSDGDRRGF